MKKCSNCDKKMMKNSGEKSDKKWIKEAIKNKGALREELHVKKGEKIPESKIKMAEKKGGKEGKRAHLAETLRHLGKKKGK